MTQTEFDAIMDRLRGLYPKWKPTPEQRAYFSGKVIPLHENDLIGAIDAAYTEAKTTYAPNLGELVKRAWANRQSRSGQARESTAETPIDAMRRLYGKPLDMSDHEVVCRVAAGDIRAHEGRTAELDQPARWLWVFKALRRHFPLDESVYWADQWCGTCEEHEPGIRIREAEFAAEYGRYERGERTIGEMLRSAMPTTCKPPRADTRRREVASAVRGRSENNSRPA